MPMIGEEETVVQEDSVLDVYKSLSFEHRTEEEELLTRAIECGVVPYSLRYGIMKSTYRGAIRDGSDELYYFSYVMGKDFKLIKADTKNKVWEVNRIMKKSSLGCDLMKSEDKDEEEDDKKKKVKIPASGESEKKGESPTGEAAINTIPEAQNIAQQDTLTTDVHPGAAGGTTPDNNAQRWHPEEEMQRGGVWSRADLLKAWGQQLQATAPVPSRMPTDKERQYMVEVLGRTPDEVVGGNVQLSPTQRAHFNMWLNRSLNKSIDTLRSWLSKNA